MDIYIDFDDCLCETARWFVTKVKEMYGKDIPYEKVRFFDLQKSFDLTTEQYELMMAKAHTPDVLLSFEETPGASKTVNEWLDAGFNVSVITGRPYSAYGPSRMWLDRHGLERVKLYCFNKYGRDGFDRNSEFCLEPEDYYKLHFDYAIEDSPAAFRFFEHLPKLKVMVFDRPWNRESTLPGENFLRCCGWEAIRANIR
jgi:5'(3')-deoxyribonucleotidase